MITQISKMITQIFLIFEYFSHLCNRFLIHVIRDFWIFSEISFVSSLTGKEKYILIILRRRRWGPWDGCSPMQPIARPVVRGDGPEQDVKLLVRMRRNRFRISWWFLRPAQLCPAFYLIFFWIFLSTFRGRLMFFLNLHWLRHINFIDSCPNQPFTTYLDLEKFVEKREWFIKRDPIWMVSF